MQAQDDDFGSLFFKIALHGRVRRIMDEAGVPPGTWDERWAWVRENGSTKLVLDLEHAVKVLGGAIEAVK